MSDYSDNSGLEVNDNNSNSSSSSGSNHNHNSNDDINERQSNNGSNDGIKTSMTSIAPHRCVESFRTLKGHDLTIAEDFQLLLSVGCVLDLRQAVVSIEDLVTLARRIVSIQSPSPSGSARAKDASGQGELGQSQGVGQGHGEGQGPEPGPGVRHRRSTLNFLHAVVTFAQQGLPMDPAPLPREGHSAAGGNDMMGESGESQEINTRNADASHASSDAIGNASNYLPLIHPFIYITY